MSEYWKSLPRKFCDICKCWFADNKASIDFHERGKRHKENAAKRIQEIQKKGIKDFKKQQKLEDDMAKIEKAALAAYQKDLENMDGDCSLPKSELPVIPKKSSIAPTFYLNEKLQASEKESIKKEISLHISKSIKAELPKQEESEVTKKWYEGVTEEGYKYYWNAETSESVWEPPEEGYVSIEEQNETNTEAEEAKDDTVKGELEEESSITKVSCIVGPQPKVDPYGEWVAVEKKEPVKYDFQLPNITKKPVEVVIPVYKEENILKFKEKTVGSLTDSDSSAVTFKKRKFTGSLKRNARQRTEDD